MYGSLSLERIPNVFETLISMRSEIVPALIRMISEIIKTLVDLLSKVVESRIHMALDIVNSLIDSIAHECHDGYPSSDYRRESNYGLK